LLPAGWRVESPARLPNSPTILNALISARYNAVNLATLCSTILLMHVCASAWFEARSRQGDSAPEGERGSVPRREVKRSLLYILFTICISLGMAVARLLFDNNGLGIWQRTQRGTSAQV
jgi:hypothetical protein